MNTVMDCPVCGVEVGEDQPMVRTFVSHRFGRNRWRTDEPVCLDCASGPGWARSSDGKRESWPVPAADRTDAAPCVTCGRLVAMRRDSRRTVYACSATCRTRHYKVGVTAEKQVLTCAGCGSEMTGRADRRYCSPACRQRAHRQRQEVAPTLALPQPSKRGPRRPHRQVLDAIVAALGGQQVALADITVLDASVTAEDARVLADELRKATKELNRVRRLLESVDSRNG